MTRKEKKGKKIMKKIMIMAVAMFAMATTTFAAEENTNATAAYNMNIKMVAWQALCHSTLIRQRL